MLVLGKIISSTFIHSLSPTLPRPNPKNLGKKKHITQHQQVIEVSSAFSVLCLVHPGLWPYISSSRCCGRSIRHRMSVGSAVPFCKSWPMHPGKITVPWLFKENGGFYTRGFFKRRMTRPGFNLFRHPKEQTSGVSGCLNWMHLRIQVHTFSGYFLDVFLGLVFCPSFLTASWSLNSNVNSFAVKHVFPIFVCVTFS